MVLRVLAPEDVAKLHQAAVSAGLAGRREVLLSDLPPELVARLVEDPTPGGQLLLDLRALNRERALVDGRVPLACWIQNAVVLSHARPEHEIFVALLERAKLGAKEVEDDGPPGEQTPPEELLREGRLRSLQLHIGLGIASVASIYGLQRAVRTLAGDIDPFDWCMKQLAYLGLDFVFAVVTIAGPLVIAMFSRVAGHAAQRYADAKARFERATEGVRAWPESFWMDPQNRAYLRVALWLPVAALVLHFASAATAAYRATDFDGGTHMDEKKCTVSRDWFRGPEDEAGRPISGIASLPPETFEVVSVLLVALTAGLALRVTVSALRSSSIASSSTRSSSINSSSLRSSLRR